MKKTFTMENRLITLNVELGLLAILHETNLVINDITVTTTAARLRTFLKGTSCVTCGAKAKYFAVDVTYEKTRPHYHLNLYTEIAGKEEMMTSDHIHPKSKGGSGGLSNRQPMCRPCNFAKSDKLV